VPIDSLGVWLDEFEKIPQDMTGDMAPKNLADFVDQRVTGKLDTSKSIVQFAPPPSFTWQKGIFESTLRIICKIPSPDPISPAIKMATAWQQATLASTFTVQPQAKMNKPFPATSGIVATSVSLIDPASVAAAFAYLVAELSGVKPVSVQKEAVFPKAIRQAFMMLTVTITGIDTKTPPAGPIPFSYPLTLVE
jgi:hypothetical protein